MPEFRKKPVVIDAQQWDGTPNSAARIIRWVREQNGRAKYWAPREWDKGETEGTYLSVHTLEGRMLANPNDWIIRGVQGEFYPCKPDIFEATYEPVEQSTMHNPWDAQCVKNGIGEPTREGERCLPCRPLSQGSSAVEPEQ